MAIKSGFFNSVNGDRLYNADDISNYFDGLISNGVYENVDDGLQVKAISGMEVGVQSGRAIIDCRWIKNDTVYNLTINSAHVTLNRYTAIILRLDLSNRVFTIVTKDGENATNPSKPAVENSTLIKELCLAYVYVGAGVISISQSNITDMRGSSSCPWVTGIIKQVDTSELFLQWQTAYEEYFAEMEAWKVEQKAAFESWLSTLTEQLQVNTYIQEYKNVVTTSEEVTEINIGISDYDPTTDILYANINGVMFVENEDYTISGTGSTAKIVLTNSIKANNTVEFRVLKSKIGQQTT
jgi:hypothetical protein